MKKCCSHRGRPTHACSAMEVYDFAILKKVVEKFNAIPQLSLQVSTIKINDWDVVKR